MFSKRNLKELIGYFEKVIEFNKDTLRGPYNHNTLVQLEWKENEISEAKIRALSNILKKEIEKDKIGFKQHGLRMRVKTLLRIGWTEEEIDRAINLAKPASLFIPVITLVILAALIALHLQGII